jgi:hypothetical protein
MEIEDMFAYEKFSKRISPIMRKNNNKVYIIALVSSICIQSAVSFLMGKHSSEVIFACIVACPVFILAIFLSNRFKNNWIYRQIFQNEFSKSKYKIMLFCEHELELMPYGIRATTNSTSALSKYTEIDSIEVTPTHIFIFNSMPTYIIPKAKVSEGDLDAFITALKDRIQPSGNSQTVMSN